MKRKGKWGGHLLKKRVLTSNAPFLKSTSLVSFGRILKNKPLRGGRADTPVLFGGHHLIPLREDDQCQKGNPKSSQSSPPGKTGHCWCEGERAASEGPMNQTSGGEIPKENRALRMKKRRRTLGAQAKSSARRRVEVRSRS